MADSFTTPIPAELTPLQAARARDAKEWTKNYIHRNDIICGGYRFHWNKDTKQIIANPGHPLEMVIEPQYLINFLYNEMEKGTKKRLEYQWK